MEVPATHARADLRENRLALVHRKPNSICRCTLIWRSLSRNCKARNWQPFTRHAEGETVDGTNARLSRSYIECVANLQHAAVGPHCMSGRKGFCNPNASRHDVLSNDSQSSWQQKLCSLNGALLLALSAILLEPSSPLHLQEAQARARLSAEEERDISVFREARPAVVFITTYGARRDTFTPNILEMPQGAGSGFVWDKGGHLVTSLHVVKGSSDVRVTFTNGNDVKAKVMGIDEDKDLAVLYVDPAKLSTEIILQPLALGTSSDLVVGQHVYALGNPFGLDHSLTTGIISGTGREINSGFGGRPIQDVIQTDASINPGNSGGPLLDSEGSVIGINTAIYSTSGTNSGIGFAIPVDTIRLSVEQILQFGKVTRPVLGISFAPDQTVEQIGVAGILVLDTKPESPAKRAGIQGTRRDDYGRLVFGDIITAVNGKRTKNTSDLYKALDKCKVGDTLDLEVLREHGDQAKEHISVTLEAG